MARVARHVKSITFVDLYAEYPRFDIDVEAEQQRLLDHDVILFQFPVFWHSTPSILKEWQDLVLEPGFAYGKNGDKLAGKHMMLALTGASPQDAYMPESYERFPLRTLLTPLEQTANLCRMRFSAPYVLYASLLAAETGYNLPHIKCYRQLLEAVRDDRFDFAAAEKLDVISAEHLPIITGH